MNIYLIGYRCCGKSTVGKMLAGHLGSPFVDMDQEIVERTGRSIRQTVESFAWAAFRGAELTATADLAKRRGLVVATGGGVVLDKQNIAEMKNSGVVVWLQISPDTVLKRMRADKERPPLTELSLRDEIRMTMQERDPLYKAAGDFAVDTERMGATAVCEKILSHLKEKGITKS